jgi:hypothetical protein
MEKSLFPSQIKIKGEYHLAIGRSKRRQRNGEDEMEKSLTVSIAVQNQR